VLLTLSYVCTYLLYFPSVTKQEQQHVYDYVSNTVVHDQTIKGIASKNKDVAITENPSYDTGTLFTNKGITANEDAEHAYESVHPQSRQIVNDDHDINVFQNPTYVETKFT